MNKASAVGFKGELVTKVIRAPKANLGWRLKNYSRWSFIIGWIQYWLAKLLSRTFGILTITSELKAVLVKADGSRVNYGILSHKLVTDAGVAFLVDDWDGGANDFSLFNYHGCGTGSVAENVADTALGTESTTILNPDSTRATSSWIASGSPCRDCQRSMLRPISPLFLGASVSVVRLLSRGGSELKRSPPSLIG